MRKIYQILMLCVMCIALASCNKEKKFQQQYMEACENNDFAKASSIVDRMEVECDRKELETRIDEHRSYVRKKEILFLIAQGTEESANRLMFLLNDISGSDFSSLDYKCDMTIEKIVELAISQGNEFLAKKIVETGAGINENTINAACSAKMGDLVLLMLANSDLSCNATVEKFLIKYNLDEYVKYLESLLSSPIEGSRIPAGVNHFQACMITQPLEDIWYESKREFRRFYHSVAKRNNLCKKVLSEAIRIKNLLLAKKAISSMKDNIVMTDGSYSENIRIKGVRVNGDECYVQYCPEDINEAKKTLNDAINSGYFN